MLGPYEGLPMIRTVEKGVYIGVNYLWKVPLRSSSRRQGLGELHTPMSSVSRETEALLAVSWGVIEVPKRR